MLSSQKHRSTSWVKSIAITIMFVFLFYSFLSSHPCCQSYKFFQISKSLSHHHHLDLSNKSPTNINHIVFGIVSSSNTWGNNRGYIGSWWKTNTTRGFVFLDNPPVQHLPWPSTSPPFKISEYLQPNNKHAMVRVIEETFWAENRGVRWYVMAEEDTVLMTENLVDVLSRYDHNKCFYIGANSEGVVSNNDNSFDMAFAGAGYALSYPLAKALVDNGYLDDCVKRYYPNLVRSDHILQSCIADLGVSFTQENGFHQIDLVGDISGLLSSHPNTPLISLHHPDTVAPIFPSMDRHESIKHMMKAAEVDQRRMLRQSVCYNKKTNWTFSVSWGYTVHVYEQIMLPSHLYRPIETFSEGRKGASFYMFNPRRHLPNDPCEAPHVLFFDSVEDSVVNHTITTYSRPSQPRRRLPPCAKHSADGVSKIRVLSPMQKLGGVGSRRECCDVVEVAGIDSMIGIKLRSCVKDEIIV